MSSGKKRVMNPRRPLGVSEGEAIKKSQYDVTQKLVVISLDIDYLKKEIEAIKIIVDSKK